MARNGQGRSRLTFSNVISLIALFVALGGSAYAAGVLPPNSVGRAQLQADAVTSKKIAHNSVGRSELKPDSVTPSELAPGSVGPVALQPELRQQLAQLNPAAATQGAQGPAGPQGATGSQGPAGAKGPKGDQGPGAVRLHYAEHASTSPTRKTVTDISGLRMEAECEDTGSGTQLNLAVSSPGPATAIETISVDNGTGEPGFAESNTANLQFHVPEGTTTLGGPSTGTGEYARVFADLLYVAADKTTDLRIGLVLDGTAGTCAIDGVGVPA